MTSAIRRTNKQIVESRGWRSGTDLEDRAAVFLSRVFGAEEVAQQYRVGAYRADFAWLDVKVIVEIDGWHHRSPESAAKDAVRDAWLRSEGWLVLRVDDRHGVEAMLEALVRACRVIHGLRRIGDPETIKDQARKDRKLSSTLDRS